MVENSLAFSQDVLIRADPVTLFNHCLCLPWMRPCIPDLELKTWSCSVLAVTGLSWPALGVCGFLHVRALQKSKCWDVSDVRPFHHTCAHLHNLKASTQTAGVHTALCWRVVQQEDRCLSWLSLKEASRPQKSPAKRFRVGILHLL